MTDKEQNSLEITQLPDGRNSIIFRKAALKGKVTSTDLMNTILIAARMQTEKFIEKLSRGAPLETAEIKALKELAEIAKMEVQPTQSTQPVQSTESIDTVKSKLYQALTERLSQPKE